MSGIKKRKIFMSQLPYEAGEPNGRSVYRFTDWAMCVTSQGDCFEPFILNDMFALGEGLPTNFDPKDMMRRVDEIKSHSPTGERNLVAEGGRILHSHNNWLREGP